MGRYHGREEAAAIHIGHADGPRSPIKGTLCGLPVCGDPQHAARLHYAHHPDAVTCVDCMDAYEEMMTPPPGIPLWAQEATN